MAHNIDGEPHMTIAEAVEFMGCTDGWVRILCREGKLASRMLGKRLRLVEKRSAAHVKDTLTTRAVGKKHLAKRPAAGRKKVSKRKPGRK